METARRAAQALSGADCRLFTVQRLLEDGFLSIPDVQDGTEAFYQEQFSRSDALIFVSALGIAVRRIAPYVKDKFTDPAVLCLDENGIFVISVLSGHIGGANLLAEKLADALHAIPVITTATDIRHRFSVDAWAKTQGLLITDRTAAKEVSAAILEGDVPFLSDLPVSGSLPAGLVPVWKAADFIDDAVVSAFQKEELSSAMPLLSRIANESEDRHKANNNSGMSSRKKGLAPGTAGEIGILVSWEIRQPFRKTLRLVPKVLYLGIGCRKGISMEAIEEAVEEVFAKHRLDRKAVAGVCSIDRKAEEQGLLAFCKMHHWPVTFYTAQELRQVPGTFASSSFVEQTVGVENVCERSAVRAAGRLLVPKTACSGVTVAVGVAARELRFY